MVYSKFDPYLFLFKNQNTILLLFIYVDDLLMIGNNPMLIDKLVHKLSIEVTTKDLGKLLYFLREKAQFFSSGHVLNLGEACT